MGLLLIRVCKNQFPVGLVVDLHILIIKKSQEEEQSTLVVEVILSWGRCCKTSSSTHPCNAIP